MSHPDPRSALYRLIQAGQLAHQALLVPLRERGLEPGDDAVLFALGDTDGASEEDMAETLGLPHDALAPRLARLVARDLVAQRRIEDVPVPGYELTERGVRMRALLAEHWAELEGALFGELKAKHRKGFARTLKRFVALLQL